MTQTVSGILFDVGGVLVNSSGVDAMSRLLGTEPKHDELYARWLQSPSVVAHETGKIDVETFAVGVIEDLDLPVAPDRFLRGFSNWPNKLLPGAQGLLRDIPGRYLVAALSNTSHCHWEKI